RDLRPREGPHDAAQEGQDHPRKARAVRRLEAGSRGDRAAGNDALAGRRRAAGRPQRLFRPHATSAELTCHAGWSERFSSAQRRRRRTRGTLRRGTRPYFLNAPRISWPRHASGLGPALRARGALERLRRRPRLVRDASVREGLTPPFGVGCVEMELTVLSIAREERVAELG